MEFNTDQHMLIYKLRTYGFGVMDCKKALEENDWDYDKAYRYLILKGAPVLKKVK